jgi:hypothetical protein
MRSEFRQQSTRPFLSSCTTFPQQFADPSVDVPFRRATEETHPLTLKRKKRGGVQLCGDNRFFFDTPRHIRVGARAFFSSTTDTLSFKGTITGRAIHLAGLENPNRSRNRCASSTLTARFARPLTPMPNTTCLWGSITPSWRSAVIWQVSVRGLEKLTTSLHRTSRVVGDPRTRTQ